jgi:TonB-dependent starch-binding outer membrane protein SusC
MKKLNLFNFSKKSGNSQKIFRLIFVVISIFASIVISTAQTLNLKGTVIDSQTGETLPGVNVVDLTTKKTTVTDVNGIYSLSGISGTSQLKFTFIGYDANIVNVDGKSLLNVRLTASNKELDEVVVVGYGVVKKSDLTSSIAKVSDADIVKTPVNSLEQALQGNAAGVMVINTSAEPGGDITMRIRGGSSILAGNSPLLVVDGFPMDGKDLSMINPSDVVSMEVMKDASSTAIYGSRGANGVIMVTTKSGNVGVPRVEFNTRITISEPRHIIPMLDGPLYQTYNNIGRRTMGESIVTLRPDTFNTVDYQGKLFLPVSYNQEYNLSVSGGGTQAKYLISSGYLTQQGLLRNSNFDRFSLRGKFDIQMTNKLQMQVNVSNTSTDKQAVGGGDSGATMRTLMLNPSSTPSGTFVDGLYIDEATGEILSANSEISNSLYTSNITKNAMTDLNLAMNWTILPGMILRSTGGYRITEIKGEKYVPRSIYLTQNNVDKNNIATLSESSAVKWLNENTLTYMFNLNNKHNFTAMVGQTWERTDGSSFSETARGFETDAFLWNDMGGAKVYDNMSSSAYEYSLFSLLGRMIYSYDGKYLSTVTWRSDGSSRFGPDSKWGNFPSISGAWVASKEDFLKNSKAISNLKVRLSYGLTGNDRIGNYQSWSTLSSTKLLVANTSVIGYTTSSIGDDQLKWEQTEQLNGGIDLGLFNNRFNFTVDLYNKFTHNLLYNYRLPATSGYTSVTTNIGNILNQGIELEFTSKNIVGKFMWSTSINGAFNKGKITDLGGDNNLVAYQMTSTVNSPLTYLVVGQPLGTFKGYQTDGVYKDWKDVYSSAAVWVDGTLERRTQPGYVKYKDQNGDGIIDERDKVVLGHAQPDWTLGFTNTFSYGGFDLLIFFNGAFGNSIVNVNKAKLQRYRGGSDNQVAYVMNGWRPFDPNTGDPGYSGTLPRAVYNNDYSTNLTDLFLEDGSYLRLKTISLSYNVPQKLVSKFRIRSCKIQVYGINLLTWTKYTGMDPEASSSLGDSNISLGIDQSSYPASKSVVFGLSLGF